MLNNYKKIDIININNPPSNKIDIATYNLLLTQTKSLIFNILTLIIQAGTIL